MVAKRVVPLDAEIRPVTGPSLMTIDRSLCSIIGMVSLTIGIYNGDKARSGITPLKDDSQVPFNVSALVVEALAYDLILGHDFMTHFGLDIWYSEVPVRITGHRPKKEASRVPWFAEHPVQASSWSVAAQYRTSTSSSNSRSLSAAMVGKATSGSDLLDLLGFNYSADFHDVVGSIVLPHATAMRMPRKAVKIEQGVGISSGSTSEEDGLPFGQDPVTMTLGSSACSNGFPSAEGLACSEGSHLPSLVAPPVVSGSKDDAIGLVVWFDPLGSRARCVYSQRLPNDSPIICPMSPGIILAAIDCKSVCQEDLSAASSARDCDYDRGIFGSAHHVAIGP
ncbi:hypothetical protein FOZ63_030478, partial [Perkinsus olseni]